LDVDSVDGEFYVYEHITHTNQIIREPNAYDYPDTEELQMLPTSNEQYKLEQVWIRFIPDSTGDYIYNVIKTKKLGRGAIPATVVERKRDCNGL